MEPERDEILRDDFPVVRKGYDPAAVDAHLAEIADSLDDWRQGSDSSRAESAGAKVTEIIQLAERKAAEIEADARTEAKRIRELAEKEARELVEKARESVSRLVEQADQLRGAVGSLTKQVVSEVNPEPVIVPEPTPVPEPEPTPEPIPEPMPEPTPMPTPEPPLEPAAEPVTEPEPPARSAPPGESAASTEELIAQLRGAEPPVPGDSSPGEPATGDDNGDAQAARLVAMNMALDGSSRADVEKHLADNFDLGDSKELLDEVYARAGK